ASSHRQPPGSAGRRRAGRARRPAHDRRSGPARSRVPPAAARTTGDPRAPSLPGLRALRDRRDARHPAWDRTLTTPPRTSRHAGRPRGGRADRGQGRSNGMTQPRDIDRLLDQWFADGSSVAPDRVIDIVADRIERQPQRPAWRLDWRHLSMNPMAKAGVAIAAVVLIALVGYNLLPGRSTGVGGPAPTASPTVTPSAAPSAASTAAQPLPDGMLTA